MTSITTSSTPSPALIAVAERIIPAAETGELMRRLSDQTAPPRELSWRDADPAVAGMMDVMIDTETLGTKPGAAILSVGAVMFGMGGLGERFYAPVQLSSCTDIGLVIDAATVQWWMRQSDEARAAAFAENAAPIWRVLVDLNNWLTMQGAKYPWCHGAGFDAPLLEAAYKACGLVEPWKFHNIRDTRTLYDLAGVKVDRRGGTHHHALDDAIAQAEAAALALRIIHVNKTVNEVQA